MKKYYISLLGVLSILLGYFAGYLAVTNHWFEDERDVYFPITKEQLKEQLKVKKVNEKMATDFKPNPNAQ